MAGLRRGWYYLYLWLTGMLAVAVASAAVVAVATAAVVAVTTAGGCGAVAAAANLASIRFMSLIPHNTLVIYSQCHIHKSVVSVRGLLISPFSSYN